MALFTKQCFDTLIYFFDYLNLLKTAQKKVNNIIKENICFKGPTIKKSCVIFEDSQFIDK